MLFDLRGKRRRAVQATYLILALLMGGSLVLFGIGSDAGGGLLDAIGIGGHGGGGGGHGGGNGGPAVSVEDRIEDLEEQLAEDPQSRLAAVGLVRARHQAGIEAADSDGGHGGAPALTDESLEHFRAATDAWEQYLDLGGPPDQSAALVAAQAYASLGEAAGAADAQAIVARGRPSSASFGTLALYRYLAGDTRAGDEAAERAISLADRTQRTLLRQRLADARRQAEAGGPAPVPSNDTGG